MHWYFLFLFLGELRTSAKIADNVLLSEDKKFNVRYVNNLPRIIKTDVNSLTPELIPTTASQKDSTEAASGMCI